MQAGRLVAKYTLLAMFGAVYKSRYARSSDFYHVFGGWELLSFL